MADTPRAVVAGTVSLDLVTSRADATTARAAVGNSGANIAVRLAAAGFDVSFVCLIGDDRHGELVLADLERWGVATDGVVVRPGYATPVVYQVTAGDGSGAESLSSSCPRCSRPRGHLLELPTPDEIPAVVWERASRADAVVTDIAGGTGTRLLEHARDIAWYEASLREATSADMTQTALVANVVKVSDEDADFYADALGCDAGPAAAPGRRWDVVTCGAEGVNWRLRGESWQHVPAVAGVEAVDTIGAGDAFTAGVLRELVASGGIEDAARGTPAANEVMELALRAGGASAARACEAIGARGDMSTPGGGDAWIANDAPFACGRCDR